ncbi:hypothetical protein FGB62_57g20 [Gracilaria domingensis]|nr:hypothetical protein FGB62_57g20 [Gracilaria domingensis]
MIWDVYDDLDRSKPHDTRANQYDTGPGAQQTTSDATPSESVPLDQPVTDDSYDAHARNDSSSALSEEGASENSLTSASMLPYGNKLGCVRTAKSAQTNSTIQAALNAMGFGQNTAPILPAKTVG